MKLSERNEMVNYIWNEIGNIIGGHGPLTQDRTLLIFDSGNLIILIFIFISILCKESFKQKMAISLIRYKASRQKCELLRWMKDEKQEYCVISRR